MVSSSREDLQTKQEDDTNVDDRVATNSRLWPGLTNPRIVRVSRAFGGKDRHSKVSTIRGLRDRRVRLSVPTAIQLYDLQDRLGLNQPSKVVDWLLNAAQDEIDKLPPLPMQPGNFLHFSQSLNVPRESTPPQSSSMIKNSTEHTNEHDLEAMPRYTYWNSDASQRDSPREAQREVGNGQNFRANQSFFTGLLNNAMPYSSYHQSETSNTYASHMGIHPSPGSHLGLCPSGPSMSQMFPPYMTAPTNSMDARQFGQYQLATLASQDLISHPVRTYLHSDMDLKHHNSQDSHES